MARSKSRKLREQLTGTNELDATTKMNLGKRMSGAAGVHDSDKNAHFKAGKTHRMGTRNARFTQALKDQT